MGDRLAQEGYRGFLEVDVLIDLDTDEVYLGEINPRISGASSMTNVTAGAYADVPLFLFHLLEFMDVEYTVNVEEINDRWRELAAVDVWSQLIMKETDRRFGRAAPGRTPDGHLAPERRRRAHVRAGEQRLARNHRRGRGVLPAGLWPRRFSIPWRRFGHLGHQGPDADGGGPHTSAAGTTSTAFAVITDRSRCRIPRPSPHSPTSSRNGDPHHGRIGDGCFADVAG